jgi:hypothetical protein
MKCSWMGKIGKKQSLFKLGSFTFLVVFLVIVIGFVVSRVMVSRGSVGYTLKSDAPIAPSFLSLPSGKVPASHALSASLVASDNTAKSKSSDIGSQYLVKTLNVDMKVKDTRKVADSLLAWISTTDPRATTSGTDYERVDNNLYNISLTFSVRATRYPLIYRYLRDYAIHHGGNLVTFNESVQDVTSTYVDTQSRLRNLRVEQGRLQDLVSHAQSVSDIIAIDQQLTSVEGDIESDEAQLNTLTNQVTFYTVSVSLTPLDTAAPLPSNDTGWSIGHIFRDAFSASLAFGQGVLSLLIWLLAFGLYIIPLVVVAWLGRKWYVRTRQAPQPKVATNDPIPMHEEVTEASDSVNEEVAVDSAIVSK